jgi:proteasome accessory factor B
VEKTERLLNLVSCLLAARTPVPFSDIRGRVVGYDDGADSEAMEKRFDRDKAELRALGVPIEYVAMDALGNSGYSIRKDRYFLPEIRLGVDETMVLAVLHRMATEGGAATGPNLLSALQKVSADAPLGDGLRTALSEQHAFGLRPGRGGRQEHAALDVLTEAVLTKTRVAFRHYSIERDEELDRQVKPYGLGYRAGHWYLVAHDRDRDALRTFRVDRILGRVKTVAGEPYEIPDGFDVQDHVGRPPWEFREGRPVRARIRFDPSIAWMVEENVRPGETFEMQGDGSGILEMAVTDRERAIQFVLKHGRNATVLGPPVLKKQAKEMIEALRSMHEGSPTKPRKLTGSARAAARRRRSSVRRAPPKKGGGRGRSA